MGKIVLTNRVWTRDSVLLDPNTAYIFGDNLEGCGNAGQACIRGLSNAIGLPTKRAPRTDDAAFLSDDFLDPYERLLGVVMDAVDAWEGPVVFHVETGRGLARLHETAPACYGVMLYEIMRRAA